MPPKFSGPLLASGVILLSQALPTQAQITPDSTLPNNSRVTPDGSRSIIDGGTTAGPNLFHSFSKFSVPTGGEAFFNNATSIDNIITRVTGANLSNIDGLIRANGTANLFLINPNGIVFGPNARLDIGGSFFGLTAEGIRWGEQGLFSATSPESSTLLAIDPNVGFHKALANYQARIENQGSLQVGPGETLSLQGTDINITGNLTAEGGNVEVLGNNISLRETSTIDVTSGSSDGGTVRVFATGNTSFLGQILARGGGDTGKGGFVEVSGGNLQIGGTVDTSANSGNNGTLFLDPKDIVVAEGGTLSGQSLSQSLSSNNVRLQANNDISIDDDITGTSGNSLTLEAGRSITLEQNRTISLGGGDFLAKINDENAVVTEREPGIARMKIDFESQIITEGGSVVIEPGIFGGVALGEIELDKGTIDAGGGNILLRGRGENGESNRYGIYLHNSSLIETTGTGTIDLIGTGGDGINNNPGIWLTEQSVIRSVDGDINLSGTGGNATGAENHGIRFNRSTIESLGMGNISLTGTGVSSGGNFYSGISSRGAGISTLDGDITLTGTGLDSNNDSTSTFGLTVLQTTIESTGEGEITLTGTGGTGGDFSVGVEFGGARSRISSNNGDINLIGTSGTGGNFTRGIAIETEAVIVSEGGGNITIIGTSNGVNGEENIGVRMIRGNVVETQGGGTISLRGIGSQDSPDIMIETSEISQTGTSEILSLQGNRIELGRSQILSSGLLQLQPTEPTADLSITFDTVALGGIETSSEILMGSETNSGTITLSGNALFNSPVSILSPLGNGSINSQGVTLVENENATFNFTASQDINLADSNIYTPQGLNLTSINGTVDTTGSFIFDPNDAIEAPLIPDGSLGTERSIVVPIDGESQRIEGGAARGSSLFHSFAEFNIGIGENVYFANPNAIANILTRVTGNNPSQIFGTLGVDGPANLWLLNPNGTIFGPTASLDVSSSFLTTSARAIRLENGEIFSSNSSEPLPQQLLNVNPQALLFTSGTIGSITNQGNLEVPKGQSLLLVGGDVTLGEEFLETFILESSLEALGGRIEIGGLTAPGEIGLSQEGSQWNLAFPEGISRGNISLLNGARVNVASDGGGDIIVTGHDVEIVGGDLADNPSVLRGGIEEDEGSPDAVAGDITIEATGELRFADIGEIANNMRGQGTGGDINIVAESVSFSPRNFRGVIENAVPSQGVGDAGNIDIRVGSFFLSPFTVIVGINSGIGDSASVVVEATDTFEMNASGITTNVEEGNAGDITIKANQIIGGNGGPFIEASNFERGNSGRVSLEADSINLVGGFLRSQITGEGESSSVNLEARSIELPRLTVRSDTFGPSRGSDLNITAENIVIQSGNFQTTTSGPNASGDGGDINIMADRIEIGIGGPRFSAGTQELSSGNGGNINITARELLVNQGRLNTGVLTDATGTGGTINLRVAEVLSLTGEIATEIRADVGSEGRGDGGNINITAGELRIAEGSVIQASTQGQGNAGQITVNAPVVDISGSNSETGLPSGLFTSTNTEFAAGSMTVNSQVFRLSDGAVLSARSRGNGEGGRIIVNTDSFEATNGGQLVTTTFGEGIAGNIEINALQEVLLSGSDSTYLDRIAEFEEIDNLDIVNDISETGPQSGLYANTTDSSTGAGGTIALEVGQLTISDGARISANSAGEGMGGNIDISSDLLQIEDRGGINAATASGRGGNIVLHTPNLRLRGNSNIATNAGGTGNGGNITINADTILALEDSNITANAVRGRGGNISIATSGLFFSPDSDITASSEFGISGIVTVDTPDADPARGIVELPTSVVDASEQVRASCAIYADSSFTITGRGGLPPNPTGLLRGRTLWSDQRIVSSQEQPQFIEATGWTTHANGQVELVSQHQVNDNTRASTLNTQASQLLKQGKTQEALETWQKAAEAYQRAGDRLGALGTIINQAQALQSLGLYRRSQTLLEQVNRLLENQPDSSIKATALQSLGITLQAVGELERSREVLEQSLAMSHQLGLDSLASATLLNLGNVASASSDAKAAIKFYQQATEQATTPLEKTEALLNQLAVYVEPEQADEARDLLEEIEAELENLPVSRDGVYARVNLAGSLMASPSIPPNGMDVGEFVSSLLAEAVAHAQQLQDKRGEAIALHHLGSLYQKTGQLAAAQTLTEKSLLIAEGIPAQELVARSHSQLGQILKQLGKIPESIIAYSNAVKGFESLRQDLVAISQDVQFDFRDTVEPAYRDLVGLLLRTNPSQDQLKQAIDLIEALQLAELDNFFQDTCLDAKPEKIDEIDPTAAVIYPIILPESLEIILLQQDRPISHHQIKLSQGEIEKAIRAMRKFLGPTFSLTNGREAAEKLYDWLIEPFEEQLAANQIETLVFVLDVALRDIPMAALYDKRDGAFLVEKYAIALTPGLQLLKSPSLEPDKVQAFAAGISQSVQGFAPLPAVEWELEKIAELVSSQQLLNQEFTRNNLGTKTQENPAPIVHLATHGQFSSNREETFILAWDEKINVTEFERLLRRQETSDATPIELLVLSACQTATGDERAALGLAGVAVRSGARSTLATLWSVADNSTAQLIVEFYRQLTNPNITKAEALRRAQVSLLKGRYKPPYFWAPFVLVGNWQ